MSTKVLVNVDRKAAIRRGINGNDTPITIDVDVSQLSQADRDEFAERYYVDRGVPILRTKIGPYVVPITVIDPTAAGVSEAFRAEVIELANREAKEQARVKADQDEGLRWLNGEPVSQSLKEWVGVTAAGDVTGWSGDAIGGKTYEWVRQYVHSHYGDAATKEACATRDRQLERETQQRKSDARMAAIAELHREHIAPRLDWVRTYGSSDLRRMVDEGMPTWADLYAVERAEWDAGIERGHLMADRPGWVVISEDDAKTIEPPKRPRARAWAVLDTARAVEPAAKLGRYKGQYVAYAEYRGQTIIWPAE